MNKRWTMLHSVYKLTIVMLLLATLNLSSSGAERHYPVGCRTFMLTDSSRTDAFTKRPRQLVTEVWYPASDASARLPEAKLSQFYPSPLPGEVTAFFNRAFGVDAAGVDEVYKMHAHRDAPVRAGNWPVIIFSHGNGGFRYQNTFWFEHLCALGFVVISADHTGNAGITVLPEGVVTMQGNERGHSAVDRVADMQFLLTTAENWRRDPESPFVHHLDLSHPCAAGMSFGSMTAVKTADVDPRFKLVIAMSGAYPEHTNLTIPTLWMIGTEDRTIGLIGNNIVRNHHAKQTGPSLLFEMKNGGHFSFTDVPAVNPRFGDGAGEGKRWKGGDVFQYTSAEQTYAMINGVTTAFLNVYQRGKVKEIPKLLTNPWPDQLILDARNIGSNRSLERKGKQQ
jgi:pimeloyl-ACP methyl ester carboxylesterase